MALGGRRGIFYLRKYPKGWQNYDLGQQTCDYFRHQTVEAAPSPDEEGCF
jgi:hypothetical protein